MLITPPTFVADHTPTITRPCHTNAVAPAPRRYAPLAAARAALQLHPSHLHHRPPPTTTSSRPPCAHTRPRPQRSPTLHSSSDLCRGFPRATPPCRAPHPRPPWGRGPAPFLPPRGGGRFRYHNTPFPTARTSLPSACTTPRLPSVVAPSHPKGEGCSKAELPRGSGSHLSYRPRLGSQYGRVGGIISLCCPAPQVGWGCVIIIYSPTRSDTHLLLCTPSSLIPRCTPSSTVCRCQPRPARWRCNRPR